MQLEGSLSRFALRELLELSVISLVTGAVEVEAPAGTHRIFFVEGRCVHASAPDVQGFDALWPLFELKDAPFRFVAGHTCAERTINEPTPSIIDQAQALARQWSTIRPHIPHLDIIPELVTPANGEQVRIYEEDWPILSGVDGSRTVEEVANHAVLDPLEVCTGLMRLKERGLLKLSRRRTAPEPARTTQPTPLPPAPRAFSKLKPASAPAKPSSFFANLLVSVPQDALQPVATPLPAAPVESVAAVDVQPAAEAAPDPEKAEYDDILRLLRAS
ncbi:MAG: DUF4388 domain-containing protein [Chloroflexi bacterium]|nr:DUF4388 domain-containing protein [Chloroflexota bacterium]